MTERQAFAFMETMRRIFPEWSEWVESRDPFSRKARHLPGCPHDVCQFSRYADSIRDLTLDQAAGGLQLMSEMGRLPGFGEYIELLKRKAAEWTGGEVDVIRYPFLIAYPMSYVKPRWLFNIELTTGGIQPCHG